MSRVFLAIGFLLLSSLTSVPQVHIPRVDHRSPVLFCTAKKKTQLNLFYSNACPYSRKVINYLHQIHKKVPLTDVQNNPAAKEYLRKKGGKMQVPCLFIDGQPLYESDEIIYWLSQHQEFLDPS